MLLHALYENGADVESLEAYIRDDVERLGSRLNGIHERMKFHLTELLVCIEYSMEILDGTPANTPTASGSYRYRWRWFQNV